MIEITGTIIYFYEITTWNYYYRCGSCDHASEPGPFQLTVAQMSGHLLLHHSGGGEIYPGP